MKVSQTVANFLNYQKMNAQKKTLSRIIGFF